MRRTRFSRAALAVLGMFAAFSAPATALVHGLVHHRESAARAMEAPPTDATSVQTLGDGAGAVEAADASAEHLALHAATVAPKTSDVAPPRPVIRCDNLALMLLTAGAAGDPTARVPYPPAPGDAIAQPRAPPPG